MPSLGHGMAFVGAIPLSHHQSVQHTFDFNVDNAADCSDNESVCYDDCFSTASDNDYRENPIEIDYPVEIEPEEPEPASAPWEDQPLNKRLIRANEAQRQRERKSEDTVYYKKQIAIARHARGSALHAPAQKSHVLNKHFSHTGNLMHILRKGVGWFRSTQKPTTFEALVKQACSVDFTTNFLLKLQKY